MIEKHVHNIVGPDCKCETCDYVLRVPRFHISIFVTDNDRELVNECFYSDGIGGLVDALEAAADKLGGRA